MLQQQTRREKHIKWLRHSLTRTSPILEDRLSRAKKTAHQVARLLKENYDVNRVRLFGSLLHPDQFHADSDVDLAVEGLTMANYWDALADVLFFDSEFIIDLVDPETCPSAIWDIVEREGVDL